MLIRRERERGGKEEGKGREEGRRRDREGGGREEGERRMNTQVGREGWQQQNQARASDRMKPKKDSK